DPLFRVMGECRNLDSGGPDRPLSHLRETLGIRRAPDTCPDSPMYNPRLLLRPWLRSRVLDSPGFGARGDTNDSRCSPTPERSLNGFAVECTSYNSGMLDSAHLPEYR